MLGRLSTMPKNYHLPTKKITSKEHVTIFLSYSQDDGHKYDRNKKKTPRTTPFLHERSSPISMCPPWTNTDKLKTVGTNKSKWLRGQWHSRQRNGNTFHREELKNAVRFPSV